MIDRIILESIINKLPSGKVIILYGARQVGKTTLVERLIENSKDYLYFNADNIEDRLQLEQESATKFRTLFSNKKLIIIDEAQRVKNIGLNLKIIYDQLHIPIIATGSSAFELANNISESLTGRKHEYHLHPLSFEELSEHFGVFEEYKNLSNRLIYGSYPEIVTQPSQQKEILNSLASSYLYKDILEWNKIKKSDKLIKLLQALAFQIGNQVSYNELAQIVGINKETVENYIDLLEKSFVIFSLKSFNRNLRTELKKSKKIYFYDNGIRNALINNFNQIELRNDVGALWENYIISERYKYNSNHNQFVNCFFWRTKNQQEIDFIEERNGKLYAYEFKWSAYKKAKIPIAFQKAYPDAVVEIIRPDNYYDFLTTKKHH